MKKIILSLALVAAFSTSFVSCRDTKEADDIEDVADDYNDTMDDVEDEVEDMADDNTSQRLENDLEEGVDEIKENTGTGGTDDI
ncbi:MAG: hypothetical protein CL526_03455 [Aequorivita sp.]|nr:hypothetical protein [Aequorivita sp.]|tara:strand:- start:68708 stop:68959 length:252 start_codon:yes stop_codon:yes gene_type:complete